MPRTSFGRDNITNSPKQGRDTLSPPYRGHRDLKSYQMAEIVHNATVIFCDRLIDKRSRAHDQMVQAARGGR
jgi:restriction system protein